MAARLEVYVADAGEPEGWVSASDDDEERLFAVLSSIATASDIDARAQGGGRLEPDEVADFAHDLRQLAAAASGLEATWLSALATGAGAVEARGSALGWRMRYDRGGTTDDGADEFPTAWS